ncbi:MAG: hypothetical protein IT349_09080 [Candidatus Eisenbacteria bacterium]|nr:hypothetical protein [Candidatus Eisenbacteria bacterium]
MAQFRNLGKDVLIHLPAGLSVMITGTFNGFSAQMFSVLLADQNGNAGPGASWEKIGEGNHTDLDTHTLPAAKVDRYLRLQFRHKHDDQWQDNAHLRVNHREGTSDGFAVVTFESGDRNPEPHYENQRITLAFGPYPPN